MWRMTNLVVRRYFCMERAIEGKTISAVWRGSIESFPAKLASGINCRRTWEKASSAASVSRAFRLRTLLSRSTFSALLFLQKLIE